MTGLCSSVVRSRDSEALLLLLLLAVHGAAHHNAACVQMMF